MTKITLTWPVWTNCDLKFHPRPPKPKTIIEDAGDYWTVEKPLRHQPRHYDPMNEIEGLYRRVAAWPTARPDDALRFVNKWGFVRGPGERTDEIFETIRATKHLVDQCSDKAGRLDKSKCDWGSLAQSVRKDVRIRPRLETGGDPELVFEPMTLRDAISIQLLRDLTRGATMKSCDRPGCPEWFYHGPGTAHPRRVKYCSDRCQKAHAYMKFKEDRR